MFPSQYSHLLLIFHSSSVATIWPAWKSCWISFFLIQSHLTQLYRSRLCYKPTSTQSAKKKLHLCHKQLQSSTLCYQMTCSIPINTLNRLCQHHKWPASFLLPTPLGRGWAWSSFAAFSHSLKTFSVDWTTINTQEHRHLCIWRLVSYGSWVSSQGRLWTWRKQCWSGHRVKNK